MLVAPAAHSPLARPALARGATAAAMVGLLFCAVPTSSAYAAPPAEPRVHTYSIVARDPGTGALGVAVHSHWFQVGRLVAWAEAGVGAIATQAMTNASFGPRGLALLRLGLAPKAVLARLLSSDARKDNRQIAIVDARGRVAAWTGRRCIPAAGHTVGRGFSAQANLMASKRVWPAMARAFRRSKKRPLAQRLLAALRAAEKAGGDLRGRQSAALLVVPAKRAKIPALARTVDIRVADHPRPLDELARLLRLHRAYALYAIGAKAMASKRYRLARAAFSDMRRLAPRRYNLRFWQALELYRAGRKRAGVRIFRAVVRAEPRWRKVLPVLVDGKLLSRAQLREIQRALSAATRTKP